MFDMEKSLRERRQEIRRESKTPLVIYETHGHYGRAHLASVKDYLSLHSWPPDYRKARVIESPESLAAIKKASAAVAKAERGLQAAYAAAYAAGAEVNAEDAEASYKEARR